MFKKTVIISTSKFGNPISDYYRLLADCFIKDGFKVVFVFDGAVATLPEPTASMQFFTWPSARPTRFADFKFFHQLLKAEQPLICISNFGSTNIVSIVSFLLRVPIRINYIHTTSVQLALDADAGLYQRLLRLRKRFIYKLNNFLLTNSEGNRQDAAKVYGINAGKLLVSPYLLQSSSLTYKPRRQRSQQVCIVGRLHPSKGHMQLLKAFAACTHEHPNLVLKIVGDGHLKEELKQAVEKLNLTGRVVFTGNIPNQQIGVVFSDSLIAISASVDEALGLVNIEALREGTPLLCTRTAGSRDVVKEGVNGLFFDPSEPGSLCMAIESVLKNWELLSEQALYSFKNDFGENALRRQYQSLKLFLGI